MCHWALCKNNRKNCLSTSQNNQKSPHRNFTIIMDDGSESKRLQQFHAVKWMEQGRICVCGWGKVYLRTIALSVFTLAKCWEPTNNVDTLDRLARVKKKDCAPINIRGPKWIFMFAYCTQSQMSISSCPCQTAPIRLDSMEFARRMEKNSMATEETKINLSGMR